MTPTNPPRPPTSTVPDTPPDEPSVAGEEDPGAAEGDPALREAMQREAEVASRTGGHPPR